MQSPIRKRLLEAFTAAEGEFLSGQALADILQCSRTAVWKHMEELRKEGFEIEAIRKKGYRIKKIADKVTENEIQLGLHTSVLGKVIHYVETVDSTQKVAHQLAQEGYPEGTIVIAEEQKYGRGRLMRQWHSPKASGVWMSVILRPNLPPFKAPQFTLITAAAVAQAIADTCHVKPEIKWPNDILLNGKKVTGILTELQAESDKINAIIIGIGMNVNHTAEDFPENLRSTATSLAIATGKKQMRAQIVQAILERLEAYYQLYLEKGFAPLKLLWENFEVSIGKKIVAHTIAGSISGTARGISEDGILKLEDEEGKIHDIYSADIEVQ